MYKDMQSQPGRLIFQGTRCHMLNGATVDPNAIPLVRFWDNRSVTEGVLIASNMIFDFFTILQCLREKGIFIKEIKEEYIKLRQDPEHVVEQRRCLQYDSRHSLSSQEGERLPNSFCSRKEKTN